MNCTCGSPIADPEAQICAVCAARLGALLDDIVWDDNSKNGDLIGPNIERWEEYLKGPTGLEWFDEIKNTA